jgi:ABC-2 type transport system permease protein
MKLVATIMKTWKENLRDWKILVMVFLFSPFFLLNMHLLYAGEATTYKVGIINQDDGVKSAELISRMEDIEGQDKIKLMQLSYTDNLNELKIKIKEKEIDIGIVIPENYTEILNNAKNQINDSSSITFYGSMNNLHYTVAAVMIADVVNTQGMDAIQFSLPMPISENFLEKKLPLNEFDSYVPGLITLSILMILFPATASIVKENDKKTLLRLKLSRLGAVNFLVGISIVQAFIAIIALIISYWSALGLGYRPVGSFRMILLVGVVSSLSMVSISLVVASFLNTIFDVLTVGCFPFFLLMFFSGSMFPLPNMKVFSIYGYSFGLTDVLPLTHTANAFNKILNYGAGINDVLFDINMIVILTVIYFVAGLFLYQKRKLSKA